MVIKGNEVETVESYKYLGTIIDCQLDWSANVDAVYKKANQRLFFLRNLKQSVSTHRSSACSFSPVYKAS